MEVFPAPDLPISNTFFFDMLKEIKEAARQKFIMVMIVPSLQSISPPLIFDGRQFLDINILTYRL